MAVLTAFLVGPRVIFRVLKKRPEEEKRAVLRSRGCLKASFDSFEQKVLKRAETRPQIKPRLPASRMSGIGVSGRMEESSRRYIRGFQPKRWFSQ